MLQAGASLEIKNGIGTTPLWLASGYGNTEVVALLITGRADVEATNNNGHTYFKLR